MIEHPYWSNLIYEGRLQVHMMLLCLLQMTFFTNGIQAMQYRWKKHVNCKGDDIEK